MAILMSKSVDSNKRSNHDSRGGFCPESLAACGKVSSLDGLRLVLSLNRLRETSAA